MNNQLDFKLLNAENLAAETINEFGICSPEDIRLRDIAFAKGASIIERPLGRAAASIVTVGNQASIRIQPTDSPERKRFSIAHELGHFLLGHVDAIKKVCTEADMNSWYQASKETQANFFASELILPRALTEKRCDVREVTLEPIRSLAKDFRASLTATAIKFVRLCPEDCSVVYSVNGAVLWSYRSPASRLYIQSGKKLDERTAAYDFFVGKPMEKDPIDVDADAWVENSRVDEIVEHSMGSTKYGFTLSILWIRPE